MKRYIRSQSGLTLVELLAAVIILAIISFFVFNIVISANKQSIDQTKESIQINDAAYALKIITKDIRRTNNIIY